MSTSWDGGTGLSRRAWSWLGRRLQGRRRGPRPPLTIHDSDSFDLTTPARGDGFDFTVQVRVDWCATGRYDEEELRDLLEARRADVAERVGRVIRPLAREHQPFEPEAAERSIARELVTWCDDEGGIRATARARVTPAPEVRELQQRIALQLQEMSGQAERTRQLITHTSELRDLWQDFLSDCLNSWMTVYAVRLAENPTGIAPEVASMIAERRQHAERTANWLSEHHDRYEELDACTFLTSSDSTLRQLLKLFEVSVPEIEPSSFFSRPVESVDAAQGS